MSDNKCKFPCDCPNPNDCSHECENSCGAPAFLKVHAQGRYEWMCRKHANYHLVCLKRGVTCLERDIKAAEDSIIDVDFKGEDRLGHTCDPTDGPDKGCKACQSEYREAKRLEREKLAENEASESAPY